MLVAPAINVRYWYVKLTNDSVKRNTLAMTWRANSNSSLHWLPERRLYTYMYASWPTPMYTYIQVLYYSVNICMCVCVETVACRFDIRRFEVHSCLYLCLKMISLWNIHTKDTYRCQYFVHLRVCMYVYVRAMLLFIFIDHTFYLRRNTLSVAEKIISNACVTNMLTEMCAVPLRHYQYIHVYILYKILYFTEIVILIHLPTFKNK